MQSEEVDSKLVINLQLCNNGDDKNFDMNPLYYTSDNGNLSKVKQQNMLPPKNYNGSESIYLPDLNTKK